MYAVIQSGGKQYRVAVGDRLRVEKLAAEEGATVEIDRVLMVADGADVTIGTPTVAEKPVTARVVGHGRGDKIKVFKRKRRKGYRRTQGHRQYYTELEIVSIAGAGPPDAEA
jgi:large subunit ribosomal protein L21